MKTNKIEFQQGVGKHSHLYYDIMEPIWDFYHKWVLHFWWVIKGIPIGLACNIHHNPFNVLTPRKMDNIIKKTLKSL